MQLGNHQRALFDFTMAIKFDPSGENYNYAGQCHKEIGQLDEALHHFEHAIAMERSNGKYYYNRALVKVKLERYEEAIDDFKKAQDNLTEQKDIYNVIFNRGNCYRKLGELQLSIDDLKKAVDMKQDKAAAHNNLGLSYFERGSETDFEEALNEFSKAIQCEDHALHLNNRGLANYHLSRLEEAKKDFDEAIKKNMDDPYFYFNRGNVYLD